MSKPILSPESAPYAASWYQSVEAYLNTQSYFDTVNTIQSGLLIVSKGVFAVIAVVEIIFTKFIELVKWGIDKLLTKDQQATIAKRTWEFVDFTKSEAIALYNKHIAPLFEKNAPVAPVV